MPANDVTALTGIAVTMVLSLVNLVYSIRNNKQTMFINTVTASRLKWIDSLRDQVSEFIAVTAQVAGKSLGAESIAQLGLRRDTLLHQIVLHLNPNDSEDQKLKGLAAQARDLSQQIDAPASSLTLVLVELRDATGAYLKKEWTRVKIESNGKH